MNEMEDKVFNGKVKLYQVFKKFDKDCDGYVSYEDFKKCLDSIHVKASDDEVKALLKHVDKNKDGYLNYSSFSKVFSPDMSTKLVKVQQNDRHVNNVQPSRKVNDDNISMQQTMLNTLSSIKKEFDPKNYSDRKFDIF